LVEQGDRRPRRVKEVSLFEEALKIAGAAQVEDLGTVSNISRRDFEERETFLFRAKVPCLEYVSLMIENALLLRANRKGRVFVGFEKLSHMEPVAGLYLRIADLSERIYVFGEADWKPPRHPNMKVIAISSGSRLAREWVVIVASSTLSVALVGFDEDGFNHPVLEERTFHAFKSSDPAIVARLAALAEKMVDSSLEA
jgi:DICT domain-containing protein